MRRIVACALMIILLLSGCSSNTASKDFEDFRKTLSGMSSLTFDAKVSSLAGDEVFTCVLRYEWVADTDQGQITVIEPESVKGIKAKMSDGKWQLGYDTVLLSSPDLERQSLAPITAPRKLVDAWLDAPLIAAGYEQYNGQNLVRATLSGEDDGQTVYELWFLRETFLPIRAEIAENGQTVIKVDFIY